MRIIREAFSLFRPEEIAVAWTGGKDSTVLLDLVRKALPGIRSYRVFFNDSTIEFDEIYRFIRKMTKQWNLNLLWVKHCKEDLDTFRRAKTKQEQMEVMRMAKIHAMDDVIARYHLRVFISGIRWDEHPARSKETYFSPRTTHTRVHPILHFSLDDIWSYIRVNRLPYVSLYDQGYASLGEKPFTRRVMKSGSSERAGRDATKEKAMDRLRSLGYW